MATPTRRKLHAGSGRNGTSICGRRRGYSTIGDERPRPPAGFMNLSEARGCRQADIAWTGVVFCALAVFAPLIAAVAARGMRSEEHTSELQSLMRISYAVFCLKKKIKKKPPQVNSTMSTSYT